MCTTASHPVLEYFGEYFDNVFSLATGARRGFVTKS